MPDAPLVLTHTYADRIDARGPAGGFTYRYGGLPKVCVHPLTTPAGHCLTGFEMSDHVWHRGLWFTFKFVNGTNFWEEQEPYGVQVHTAEPRVEAIGPDAALLTAETDWTSAATGVLLHERRTITHRRVSTNVAAVDWTTRLTATTDLSLDRTPFTTWGGYGGLILRTSRGFHNAKLLLADGQTSMLVAGTPGEWLAMNGQLDGGRDVMAGFGFVDHPGNPRSPTPWYARCGPDVNYINAALLFAEPMALKAGETLTLRYRVLLRDGHWTTGEFAALAKDFRSQPGDA